MLGRWTIRCTAMAVVAILFYSVISLFELRFDHGDIFPPYSSLRANPLGLSVLYESWSRIPGNTVRQDFTAQLKEDQGQGKALLLLGTDLASLRFSNREESDTFTRFLESGGVVLLGQEARPTGKGNEESNPEIRPTQSKKPSESVNPTQESKDGEKNGPIRKRVRDAVPAMRNFQGQRLVDLMSFQVNNRPLERGDQDRLVFVTATNSSSSHPLPPLTVHSGFYLQSLTNAWRPSYLARGLPVVMERTVGRGRIVVLTESYWLSNEAMQQERNSAFVAYLLGGVTELIFDESHLGIVSNPGISELMRKYGLHGLVMSLILLAVLYIWRNSTSLVPPFVKDATEGPGRWVAGRDSGTAFANLLRRSVSTSDLIAVCVASWSETKSLSGQSSSTVHGVEAILKGGTVDDGTSVVKRRPVELYRTIALYLNRRQR